MKRKNECKFEGEKEKSESTKKNRQDVNNNKEEIYIEGENEKKKVQKKREG